MSEELIDRYLLGELSEERQAEIEDRAFSDRHYMERILAAESDLIDEYVRGGLSDSQRRMFDQRFLASAERRRKVEFARALTSVISEGTAAEREGHRIRDSAHAGFWSSIAAFFRGLRPVVGFSLAAASLLFIIGIFWVARERAALRTQVAELQAEQQTRERDRQTLERQLAEERARREELSSRLQTEQREREQEAARRLEREKQELASKPPAPPVQPAQAAPPARPSVVTLALVAGLSRGGGGARPKLTLPPSARTVRLQIGIEPGDDYRSFSAELSTRAGQKVLTEENLSARAGGRGRSVILNVPAKALEAGQYELSLKGRNDTGASEDVGYYYFEVLKK